MIIALLFVWGSKLTQFKCRGRSRPDFHVGVKIKLVLVWV